MHACVKLLSYLTRSMFELARQLIIRQSTYDLLTYVHFVYVGDVQRIQKRDTLYPKAPATKP